MKRNTFLKYRVHVVLFVGIVLFSSFYFLVQAKPTLYIIGDSTVRNDNKVQWGWGTLIEDFFDTTKINVANHATAGRSSRSFTTEGRWKRVDSVLKKGDFVLMQFGHNDGSKPDTAAKNRGTLKGTGEDTVELIFRDGRKEIVHTYGWYIRQFVRSTKAKGATPVVLSMIPRNIFKEGKVARATNDFGKWAKEVAEQEGVLFIDLNKITADKYDQLGPEKVKQFFPGDHTHTNKEGALVNAASVVEGIKSVKKFALSNYLKK
ncbi:MAG TPA: rhamnogalacturonan acetylesterase [Chitinophagaceae bacterium]|nr:rhamnogalacturonan acetylesterase [Chitinophagaceae bacterium]